MSTRQIEVRAARESDIDSVLTIERASFADAWTRDSFEFALDPGRMVFLVAVEREEDGEASRFSDQGELVGFVVALLLLDEAEVADLAVAPSARGRGIGGLLLDRVTADAHGAGVRAMYLEVRESNIAARALYDSRSFTQVGRRRGYYRSPSEDALLMRRDLPER